MMDWFRMYGEFASDPKVQSMSEAMQRRLMMLFCLRCSNTLVTLQDDEISFALRISNEDLAETKALFIRKGFVNDEWEIANWDKRQFVSDSSAARVARHRERKKQEAQEVCNVTVTPQNRTDTEQIQNKEEKAEKEKPQRASRLPADWSPSSEHIAFCKAERPELDPALVAKTFKDHWLGAGAKKADWMATWRNWVRNERRIQARASPPYASQQDKAKAFADRVTGKTRNEHHSNIIDITPSNTRELD